MLGASNSRIMNIFFLSWDVVECSHLYCDQHVVKILLEIVQMLYTAWHELGPPDSLKDAPLRKSGEPGYRPVSNKKHAMVLWVRSSRENYLWVCRLGIALSLEFTLRFNKVHSCTEHVLWLYRNIPPDFVEVSNPKAYYGSRGYPKELSAPPECMNEEYHHPNVLVANYRNYQGTKMRFARYTPVSNRKCLESL